MNATSTTLARIAAVAVVLILAAATGLLAGNWMRSADADLSAGAGVPAVAYPAYQQIESATGFDGAPAYADPHRQIMDAAADASAGAADVPAVAYPTFQSIESAAGDDAADVPAVAYPTFQSIESASGDDAFTQTWGNLDERSGREADTDDADSAPAGNGTSPVPRGPSPR